MNYASSRLSPVKPSASAAVSQAAKALKAEGHDVIDLRPFIHFTSIGLWPCS